MKPIMITVTGADARVQQSPLLTCGMVGVPVEFTFDESWEGLRKTAVFRVGMTTLDVVDVENECVLPHELLLTPYRTLRIGVYGSAEDGSLVIPTVWADAGQIQPGADPSGDASADPTLPVWQQIRGEMVKTVNGTAPDETGNAQIQVGDAVMKICVSDNAVESIELNGVTYGFDWQLIMDIWDKKQPAVLWDRRDNRILYPDVTSPKGGAYFRTSQATYHHGVYISSAGSVSRGIMKLALESSLPQVTSEINLSLNAKGKAAEAYATAKLVNDYAPLVVSFHWRDEIPTYSGEVVNGYEGDYQPIDLQQKLLRGIPVVGFFYDGEGQFLFSEYAVLQSSRYSANTNSELEVIFREQWLVGALDDDRYISADADGLIVWEH